LMVDTCHSGNAADLRGVGVALYEPDVQELEQEEGVGFYVLGASGSDEFAREQEGNGLFTQAVLEALAGAADRRPYGDGDGYVQVGEIQKYAEEKVRERSGGHQTPIHEQLSRGRNFRLGKVPD